MSKQVSNYQHQNSSLDTLGKMKDTALVTTLGLAGVWIIKQAIDVIRELH